MAEVGLHDNFSTRAALVSAIACLGVVLGLLLAGLQLGRFVHRADSFVGVELCRVDMSRGGNAPSQHDRSQCCILCSSTGDAGVIRFTAILLDAILFPTLPTMES